jgi:hypothetical protein
VIRSSSGALCRKPGSLKRSSFVAAPDLARQPGAERYPRIAVVSVKLDPTPATPSDPPPFADEGAVVEQRRLDGQDVVPGHVPRRVDTIKDNKLDILAG